MNPYRNLENRQYWRNFVSDSKESGVIIRELWQPKFNISKDDEIVTFGSCFAQHFSHALKKANYTWLCTEDLPAGVSDEVATALDYRVFSCRTGNIYTTSILNQWVDWSLNKQVMPQEIWQYKKRYYDPMRPTIEKVGFESLEECLAMREQTRLCFTRCIEQAEVFVFTLGLTEAWYNPDMGYEYPVCPQALKIAPIECRSQFVNHDYGSVKAYLLSALEKIRQVNPTVKVLLTVSPVPLIATQLSDHVMVATTSAKSILRAVCSSVADTSKHIDYFPSYEIITNPFKSGNFFADDRRSVTSDGVNTVMQHFFGPFGTAVHAHSNDLTANQPNRSKKDYDQTVCEEELLVAFANEQGKST
ncbi:GSCFA domain-containing protein [Paraglaciecola sp. MB-3u-78]|uniref:GSCFA domain-containing protein n=1 Tax=Paraglaciecola sp. MB-3u-78 TaxID=2058332 RepID=UPI0012FE9C78|nr:GSCFA domain-containing protein [Paraglaciecola sp. MB-3u-78]